MPRADELTPNETARPILTLLTYALSYTGARRGAVSQISVMGAELSFRCRWAVAVPAEALLLSHRGGGQIQVPADGRIFRLSRCVHHTPRNTAEGPDLSGGR